MQITKSRARRAADSLLTPNPIHDLTLPDRDEWIERTCEAFVAKGKANKEYYRVILELLWPSGHGLPGPYVNEDQIREAIDNYRQEKISSLYPGQICKLYKDPFRRVRELLGEEGNKDGIRKAGKNYQLVNLEIGEKRTPRTALNSEGWESVKTRYNYKCAVCGRVEPDVNFQQDHKIPRLRADIPGGGDELYNWQPLCVECNNFKSTSCRGCNLNCLICSWAFPETYAPLKISANNIDHIRSRAAEIDIDPHILANTILEEGLSMFRAS